MFFYLYQICLVIFLLQGVLWPFLLIVSGALWWSHAQKLERLAKELEGFRKGKIKREHLSELILKDLPKLKPLKCVQCGGAVLLKETEVLCPYCETRSALPKDYAATARLKPEVKRLLKSAVNHWRVANLITFPPVSWLFFLMIFAEPLVVFPITLIGSNTYKDTWADQLFTTLGETATFIIMLSAFLGFIVWMIVFIFLSNLSKDLRKSLPAAPVFEESIRGSETAGCQSCGGGIEYDSGAFACLCDYCHVENFRVEFARRERAKAEGRKLQTKSVLFGAMAIIEDFVGTFFFVLLLLCVACVLLVIVQALAN